MARSKAAVAGISAGVAEVFERLLGVVEQKGLKTVRFKGKIYTKAKGNMTTAMSPWNLQTVFEAATMTAKTEKDFLDGLTTIPEVTAEEIRNYKPEAEAEVKVAASSNKYADCM